MKKLLLASLIITGNAYAVSEKKESNSKIKIIKNPQHNPVTGVTIHKRSVNFIDIEAPADKVWVGCFHGNPESPNDWLSLYIEDEKILYNFFYLRPLEKRLCQKERDDLRKFIKGAKTLRAVGSNLLSEEANSQLSKDRGAPHRFTDKPTILFAYFTRIQAGTKCRAYFPENCDLPKNYWAGTYPLE